MGEKQAKKIRDARSQPQVRCVLYRLGTSQVR